MTCDEADDFLFGSAPFPVEAYGAYSSDPEVTLYDVCPRVIRLQQRLNTTEPSVLLWNSAVSVVQQWWRKALPPPKGRVLDLGAGLGLCALCASTYDECASVVATELRGPALEALEHSIVLNAEDGANRARVRVVDLEWGVGTTQQLEMEEPWDVVVCADCIYNRDLHAPLLKTLVHLMTRDRTTLLLAFERRGSEVDAFLESAERELGPGLRHAHSIIGPDERGVEIWSLIR